MLRRMGLKLALVLLLMVSFDHDVIHAQSTVPSSEGDDITEEVMIAEDSAVGYAQEPAEMNTDNYIHISFIPEEIKMTVEHQELVVNYVIDCCSVQHMDDELVFITNNDDVAQLADGTNILLGDACSIYTDVSCNVTGNITILSKYLGKTTITVGVKPTIKVGAYGGQEQPDYITVYEYSVGVKRFMRPIDSVFNIVLSIYIVLSNVMFGILFDVKVALKILKKPVAPAIGFVCQYGVMPVTAFLLGKAFGLNSNLAFGLITIGCSPGGGPSNIWTLNLDGDVTLSLCMTFISNLGALFMMPTWLLTLGKRILGDSIFLPFTKLIITLGFFILPMILGLGIRKKFPKVLGPVSKVVRPFTLSQVLFLLTIGLYSNAYVFRYLSDIKILFASMCLPYIGLSVGMTVATIFKQPWKRIKTIGIETAFQNAGIAMIVLRKSLPQPEADITTVVPITATLFTPIPFIIAFICRTIWLRCRKAKGADLAGELDSEHGDEEELQQMNPDDNTNNNEIIGEKEKEAMKV